MTRKVFVFTLIVLIVLQFGVGVVHAQGPNLAFTFVDPVGDHTGEIDVVSMAFLFNNTTGEYEIVLTADPAFPFRGTFRININLFDPDTGFGTQRFPSVFNDVANDFNLDYATTTITLYGTHPCLLYWDAGDRVATNSEPFGNPDGTKLFRSSVMNFPLEFLTNEDAIAYGDVSVTIAALVEIDIKPGSDPNSFNNNGHGVIPVAILSTDTFDAATVDPLSVNLGGMVARLKGKSGNAGLLVDVDDDGDLDLMLHIQDVGGVYQEGTTTAILTGETFDGVPIQGSDTIRIVR
jgi:hypothetical protein